MSLHIIYVGRLDLEKGIDELSRAMAILASKSSNCVFDIYGKGSYQDTIETLANHYPDHIRYHGRKPKSEIIPQWKRADFMIMPSQFLETFGLTACESLKCGTPVIGNKKGGLHAFIDERLDLQSYTGTSEVERIINCIDYLLDHHITKDDFRPLITQVQVSYTIQDRRQRLNPLFKEKDTVILVSDYINLDGGGVEIHIYESKLVLHNQGKNVMTYGHHAPQGRRAKIKKMWSMAISFGNISDALAIKKIRYYHAHSMVRRHSISRVIGRFPLSVNQKGSHFITHHELGLFHPYPSQVKEISQLPLPRSLMSFLQAASHKTIWTIPLLIGKYVLNRYIHKQLAVMDIVHIVPSEWMVALVKDRHPHAKVVCIPHFVIVDDDSRVTSDSAAKH